MSQDFKIAGITLRTTVMSRLALIGGAIGLAIISLFVFTTTNPDPAWPANWRLRPLVLTPIVTACGAIGAYVVFSFFKSIGWNKAVGFVLGFLGFIFSLWIGIIIGLDGTLWN